MANTITVTTLVDGPVNLIQLVNIVGDGSGEETATILVDRSAYAPTDGTKLTLEKVEGLLTAFTAKLLFDATADLTVVSLPADEMFCYDFRCFGGVSSSKAGAGYTGDLLITTASLGAADAGTFVLHMRKG